MKGLREEKYFVQIMPTYYFSQTFVVYTTVVVFLAYNCCCKRFLRLQCSTEQEKVQ